MNQPRPPQPGKAPVGSGPVRAQGTPTTLSQGEIANRLDGQRGWLNELDTSLKRRSIIALVLTCLAIGAGAAAIYISLTKNSDSDRIDALETRIENLEAAAGIAAGADSTLPGEGTSVPETGATGPETGVTLPDTIVPGGTSTGEPDAAQPVPTTP